MPWEDGLDASGGRRLHRQGAATGCLEAVRPVPLAQPHPPETGPVALFGMGVPVENRLYHLAGVGAGLFGPGQEARPTPLPRALMGAGPTGRTRDQRPCLVGPDMLATRRPLGKIATVWVVSRTSASWRTN